MNKLEIKLGKRLIGESSLPYIIAEIGVNHEGSLDQAKRLIDQAKEGGADAAKFQSYKANLLASKKSPSYWDLSKEKTTSQHELFKKYDNFNQKEYIELFEHCKSQEIDFLSTPFDDLSLDFLNPLVPFFKIASADITNSPFLKKIAQKGKPIVLSTGASTITEIESAINILEKHSCQDIALLHCILNYPTPNKDASLLMIKGLKKIFSDKIIGYSDHTLPCEKMQSLTSAFLLGAVILEKHFTHDKNLPGNDHYHSMDINDLKVFKRNIGEISELLGESFLKKPIKSEEISRLNARRSIVIDRDLEIGHLITSEDITYKRPGSGISPIHWDEVIGMRLNKALKADDILHWENLSRN